MSYGNPDFTNDADASGKRNAIRFLIGDKNIEKEQFTDNEIDAYLAVSDSIWRAAADLADIIIGDGERSRTVGITRVEYLRKNAPAWKARAKLNQAPIVNQPGEAFSAV